MYADKNQMMTTGTKKCVEINEIKPNNDDDDADDNSNNNGGNDVDANAIVATATVTAARNRL